MIQIISKRELMHAQVALFAAIALQLAVWKINGELLAGPQYVLIPIEIVLAVVIGLSTVKRRSEQRIFSHAVVLALLGLLSAVNVTSLILVLNALIVDHIIVSGPELLGSAIAIFMTNIIVFALWYWEIDSPGFSHRRWSRHDKDFQFTQQDSPKQFGEWRAEFLDYLYVSITNAINFAPADARPLTHGAKLLMASQALISVFTLALVVARSVSILGA
jgi:uncharacterized membrane protein